MTEPKTKPEKWFPLTISVPVELKPWIESLRTQGFVISRVIVGLMLAEYERQKGSAKV